MTKFVRHTIQLEQQRISQERSQKRSRKLTINFKVVMIGVVILMGFAYLIQVNQVSTGGFEIQDLEKRVQELKKENAKLELEAAHLESLNNVEERVQKLNLVSTEKVDYLEIPDSQLAQK